MLPGAHACPTSWPALPRSLPCRHPPLTPCTPALPPACPLTTVVKRQPGISNPALAKASANGNGNGRAVSPEQAKVGWASRGMPPLGLPAQALGPRLGAAFLVSAIARSTAALGRSRSPLLLPLPCPLCSAARVCQAAARRLGGPARGGAQAGLGGGAPHRGARAVGAGARRGGPARAQGDASRWCQLAPLPAVVSWRLIVCVCHPS